MKTPFELFKKPGKYITLFIMILILPLALKAQEPIYKKGDRVEALPYGSKWLKATIVVVDMSAKAAVVKMDVEKDYSGAQKEYTTHINNIRPLSETAEEKEMQEVKFKVVEKNIVKLRVDENNTVLADRPILNCPVEQKRVKNGTAPNSKLLTQLIRCIWERPASVGSDGAVTMDLTPLIIGSPRRFNPRTDLGGNPNTIVYPVKTNYIQKTFYRERIIIDKYEGVFNCSIDSFGEWKCGMAANKRTDSKIVPVRE